MMEKILKPTNAFTAKFPMMILMGLALPFALIGSDEADDEMGDTAEEVEGAADNVEDAA